MTTKNIILDDEQIEPQVRGPGWWVDVEARRITKRTDHTEEIYTLPRGSRRVTVSRLNGGRAQLALGGFQSTTVCVTGPTATINALKEACLG